MSTTLLAALKVGLFRHTRHTNQGTEPPLSSTLPPATATKATGARDFRCLAYRSPTGSLDSHNQHARVSSFRELRHRKQGYKKR